MHEIEILADGTAAVAVAQKVPWHRLGYVAPGPMTATELLTNARLGGWDVRKVSVGSVADPTTGQSVHAPDDFLIVRTNPATGTPERLGMVGRDYKVVQNEEVADFLQALVDESGAIFHTGGSLNAGRRVFVTMKLPDHLMVGGIDALDLYIAAFSRHDGWGSFTTVATPVRVVCANTERAALRNHRSIFKVRHTGHIAGRIAEAREALKLTWKHGQAFAAEAEQLLAMPMAVKEFRQFTGALIPLPADPGALAKRNHDEAMRTLEALFTHDPDLDAIRGTRWAAYNAVTAMLDHHSKVTGKRDPDMVRAERALTDDHPTAKIKTRAFELLRTP
jgi:phage/plasmid-like protein (TIGR03299 family)